MKLEWGHIWTNTAKPSLAKESVKVCPHRYVTEPKARKTPRMGFWAALLVVLMTTVAGCVQVPLGNQWEPGSKRIPVYGGQGVGQDFFVSDRNLSRLDVFIFPSRILKVKKKQQVKKWTLRKLKGHKVVMSLFALPEKRRVAKVVLPVDKIREARLYDFTFKPLGDSKRRRYYVQLDAPTLAPEMSIAVRVNDDNQYKKGSAYLNGKVVSGSDIDFKAYIDMTFVVLLHSIASRFMADLPFMIAWGLLVVLVLVGMVLVWRRDIIGT